MRNTVRMFAIAALAAGAWRGAAAQPATQSGSPLDHLPPHIKQATWFGERADFSHDGKTILFLEKTFGDVYEVELATGVIRSMTNHFPHEGFVRALYLANGDILLSGARTFDAARPNESRNERNAELWVLKHDKSGPPIALGVKCKEGPAVSRKTMKIAWTLENRVHTGEIVAKDGGFSLENQKVVFDSANAAEFKDIETQNFVPGDENRITFSAYDYGKSEVMGLDLTTGKYVDYSNAPNQYDEPEGIFPDGKFTTVECDKHNPLGIQYNDIYKLALDGSGTMERLTRFSDFDGYKSTNPVIRDDGKLMAFQYARRGDPAGVGRGILVFDLEMFGKTPSP